MKVLILHNYYQFKGGEDTVVANEARLLQEAGFQVQLATLTNHSIRSPIDKIKTAWSIRYSNQSYQWMKQKLETFNPDIVHVHNTFPLITTSALVAAKDKKIPIVKTVHNFRLECSNGTLYRAENICEKCVKNKSSLPAIVHRCYQKSFLGSAAVAWMQMGEKNALPGLIDHWITLSTFSYNRLLNHFRKHVDPERVSVVPNFSFDEASAGTHEVRSPLSPFLFVGRLAHEKGVRTLIKAFQSQPYTNQMMLTVIGEGPLASEVSRVHGVQYLGAKSRDFIVDVMKAARFLVVPSEWYECFPMVIAEAFGVGLPVIAADLGSLSEIVRDQINGYLFQPKNVEDLKAVTQKALQSNRQNLSQNCRSDYERLYSPNVHLGLLREVYEKARSR